MASHRKHMPITISGRFLRTLNATKNKARLRLHYELLEPRTLLSAELGTVRLPSSDDNPATPTPITWFESFRDVQRVALTSLASVDAALPMGVAGPLPLAVGEWIVQLTDKSAQSVRRINAVKALLDDASSDFTIISGLGAKGLILVRGQGATRLDIEASLAQNTNIEHYSLNQLITGQEKTPNDTDFVRGAMPSLSRIGLPTAWEETIGSLTTVVGVLDTGIDLAHRDLYLNIWFNQGEIPARFLDNVGNKLRDIDNDGLITFYDLNNVTRAKTAPFALSVGTGVNPNAEFVQDLNKNGYIDGLDILADPLWADGRDTDGNGEADDFFGVNFRGDGVRNNPIDGQGHGTHVAGTIGAIGGNGTGVTGINWTTSLMSLRILDNNLQGDTGSAIQAVNYARKMREQYRVDDSARVVEGANVRVLNNSWGQPGGFESSLETAINDSGNAGILFVAASGNGNFLGQGVDNDRTPFYPASYDSPSVIAVAASNFNDSLATFSNFGKTSVDLAAPGVGIRSTELGGGYGTRNGTSMATPHVAGAAALVWSRLPDATLAEVRQAVVSTVDKGTDLASKTKAGGRLNANLAVNANVFAPSVRLITDGPNALKNITKKGGATNEFTVNYFHPSGIDERTIGDDDIVLTRQWGPTATLLSTLKSKPVTLVGGTVEATYVVQAPGGAWDFLDFGDYVISTRASNVKAANGQLIRAQDVGSFHVRIGDDTNVLYVDRFDDSLEPGTLRSKLIEANKASQPTTIILNSGIYEIGIAHEADPLSTFPEAPPNSNPVANGTGWSNERTGDFDVTGAITLIGNQNDFTVVDGKGIDRVFKVHPNATLKLERLTVTGGVSPSDQGGGGILSVGNLYLVSSNVQENTALGGADSGQIGGGGIAVWGGRFDAIQSWIDGNASDVGGGAYIAGNANADIEQSTVSRNQGGGAHSQTTGEVLYSNSTFSGNSGGRGAIFSREPANGGSTKPSLSADGRFVVFESAANNLVPGDTNGTTDIFVYDNTTDTTERVSLSALGTNPNNRSDSPSISANGRFIAFRSDADNLIQGDTNGTADIFVYDRSEGTTKRVSVSVVGAQVNSSSHSPSISADGHIVAFVSDYDGIALGDTNGTDDIFIYDLVNNTLEIASLTPSRAAADGSSSSPSISADGRFVAFESAATNFVLPDSNAVTDIFVFDRDTDTIERVSIANDRTQADRPSASPSISGDGRFVAFESSADQLVTTDGNNSDDVFVYDRFNDSIEQVPTPNISGQFVGAGSPAISLDGSMVVYEVLSFEEIFDDAIPFIVDALDVFSYSIASKRSAAVTSLGDIDPSLLPTISADGRFIVFQSRQGTLVDGDTNGFFDTFLYDQNEREFISPQLRSVAHGSQLTVAGTVDAPFAISGSVSLIDSLLFNRVVGVDEFVETNNVIDTDSTEVAKIEALTQVGSAPPVHQLLRGSSAIDAGNSSFSASVDQLGTIRLTPDIGAVEAADASVSGSVFVDLNGNSLRDNDEPTLKEVVVEIDVNGKKEMAVSDAVGNYGFANLDLGKAVATVEIPLNFSTSIAAIQRIEPSRSPNKGNFQARASDDGRFVVVVSGSTNLVPNDRNGDTDVFVYDRVEDTVERVSISRDGEEGNSGSGVSSRGPSSRLALPPSFSSDGRFVAFESGASNLVFGDSNFFEDIFLVDRQSGAIDRINTTTIGEDDPPFSQPELVEGDDHSFSPLISADGLVVAYSSFAENLVSVDGNDSSDVFVWNRKTGGTQRIKVGFEGVEGDSYLESISADGQTVAILFIAKGSLTHSVFVNRSDGSTQLVSVGRGDTVANGDSFSAALSANGQFVAFVSTADNIVAGDGNKKPDVFVQELATGMTERVSVNLMGVEANGASLTPTLSADGRFVVFSSTATNLSVVKPNTPSDRREVFVYDRQTNAIAKVSQSATGEQGNGDSFQATLSADSRFITFASAANNLVLNDDNTFVDFIVAPNPFASAGRQLELLPGDRVTSLDLGLVPANGQISGRLFEDTEIVNGVYNIGEKIISDRTVFLDLNQNGLLDGLEPSTVSNSSGTYSFPSLPSFRNYVVRTDTTLGFEQVVPRNGKDIGFTVFLAAGAVVSGLDFGFRPATPTGQSSDSFSVIRGKVLRDTNGNSRIDSADGPSVGRIVYLDGGTPGVLDFNDPQEVTGPDGSYSFTGLPSTLTPVRVLLDDELIQVAPLGNHLLGSDAQPLKFPLGDKEQRGGNPQSVITADFNVVPDGFADVAVLLTETNKLSIRLNDKKGGFKSEKFDFTLSEFATELATGKKFSAPIAFITAQLDSDPKPDFAIVGNFSSNVLVLLNFDSSSKTFGSKALFNVGEEPVDIVVGQFAGDASLDLVVLNKGNAGVANDETIQVLTNNGSGVFVVGPAVLTGGKEPVSLSVGNFIGSDALDVAITHSAPRNTSTAFGGVTVVTGNGTGGFTHDGNYYQVQANPLDSAVGDFNDDGRPDLTVTNFASNSISILLGQPDGKLRIQSATLGTVDGSVNIAVADIDNDGDDDVITTKLNKRQVSIFRNVGLNPTTGDVRFEPQENIGLGEFQFGEQVPFAIANLDNDTSAPLGDGTLDIVAVPQNTDTLYVLPNRLVQGSRRVSVTGASTDIASGIDFLVRVAILPPSFAFESLPQPIVEDSPVQTVAVIDITKGRTTGSALQFSVTSANTALIANPTISLVAGTDRATVRYTPMKDASGTAVLSVKAVDAGADAIIGNADDGVFERSFTVTVLAVDDPVVTAIVLKGTNEVLDLATTPNSLLSTITMIDVRGTGRNTLALNAAKISQSIPNRKLSVVANSDDAITFGAGWKVETPVFLDGNFTHIVTAIVDNPAARASGAEAESVTVRVELRNELLLTNPLNPFDPDRDGKVLPLDALRVINELRRRGSGAFTLPTNDSEISKLYFDVNSDNQLTALDALRIINAIARNRRVGSGEGETHPVPSYDVSASPFKKIVSEGSNVNTPSSIPTKSISVDVIAPAINAARPASSLGDGTQSTQLSSTPTTRLSTSFVDEFFADPLSSSFATDL